MLISVMLMIFVDCLRCCSCSCSCCCCCCSCTHLDCWPMSATAMATALYRPPPFGCAIAPAAAGTYWLEHGHCCCESRPLQRSTGWSWRCLRSATVWPSHCLCRTSQRRAQSRCCPQIMSAVRLCWRWCCRWPNAAGSSWARSWPVSVPEYLRLYADAVVAAWSYVPSRKNCRPSSGSMRRAAAVLARGSAAVQWWARLTADFAVDVACADGFPMVSWA